MRDNARVFTGFFGSEANAFAYTQRQWPQEPGENATPDEIEAWENGEPNWALREELDAYLDEDFIETIFGAERYEYLESLLIDKSQLAQIQAQAGQEDDTLVLLFDYSLGDFEAEMKSTSKLHYCGIFECRLG